MKNKINRLIYPLHIHEYAIKAARIHEARDETAKSPFYSATWGRGKEIIASESNSDFCCKLRWLLGEANRHLGFWTRESLRANLLNANTSAKISSRYCNDIIAAQRQRAGSLPRMRANIASIWISIDETKKGKGRQGEEETDLDDLSTRGYCYRMAITTGRASSRSIGAPHLAPPLPADTSRDAARADIQTGILGETFVYLDICLWRRHEYLPVDRRANVWSLLRCLIIRVEWNLARGSKGALKWRGYELRTCAYQNANEREYLNDRVHDCRKFAWISLLINLTIWGLLIVQINFLLPRFELQVQGISADSFAMFDRRFQRIQEPMMWVT